MITTTFFPGRYMQGYQAINRLGTEIKRLGNTAFLICSPTTYSKLLPQFISDVQKSVTVIAEKFGGECCDEEIERQRNFAGKANCDVIVGIGGGKTLDTAKLVAYYLKRPVVIVPTIASTDAPCSAIAVIHQPTGEMQAPVGLNKNPDAVIVDSKIIAEAPVRFLIAGMGDALSSKFEAESCQKRGVPNLTFTGDRGSMTAYYLADLCYQTLLKYGLAARRACEVHTVTPELEHIIEANTLLSGLAFESGGLASAHGIETGFSFLKETHGYLHGEVVAFSTLVSLFLTYKRKEIINEVYSFCKVVGLPVTLSDIGIKNISDEILTNLAEAICTEGSLIYNESVHITKKSIIDAILSADNEGRKIKRDI